MRQRCVHPGVTRKEPATEHTTKLAFFGSRRMPRGHSKAGKEAQIKMPTFVGKLLILVGTVLILIGIAIVLKVRIPFLGKLPGDIRIEKDGFRLYFPIVTCIIISILLTLILLLLRRKP